MTDYPILVEDWDAKHPADMAVCETCNYEERYDPAERIPEDGMSCPACRAMTMVNKYDAAPRCKGCGQLGYWDKALAYCCSRVCMLQAAYAERLAAR